MSTRLLFALTVALFVGFGFLIFKTAGSGRETGTLALYQASDEERPRLKIYGENTQDLGKIKVSAEKAVGFRIANEGNKPLQIYHGATSCGCTFGRVKTSSAESPLFGMHSNQNFWVELAPQEEAEVEVIYRPYIMPVYGKVTRAATIKTNDPENPEVEFVIEAEVE
jgi:extradiol dioxygenase family protein